MKEFLKYEYMITPGILKILGYVGMVICVIMGVLALFSGASDALTAGISLIVLGPIACRIYAEFMLVIFEIHKELKKGSPR
jgi:hypothetical protein